MAESLVYFRVAVDSHKLRDAWAKTNVSLLDQVLVRHHTPGVISGRVYVAVFLTYYDTSICFDSVYAALLCLGFFSSQRAMVSANTLFPLGNSLFVVIAWNLSERGYDTFHVRLLADDLRLTGFRRICLVRLLGWIAFRCWSLHWFLSARVARSMMLWWLTRYCAC